MRKKEDENEKNEKNLGCEKKKKMKTQNKILATVEIAIVLCSVLLMALPAIAADQIQETQKVSASTVTAASEIYEPGPLDVFGNANEDDTIDMRDTTYIKLVIFGKKPKTKLADANYDGKISMLDVGQTKLIILGKEKELTVIDVFGEAETFNKPIKRLANLGTYGLQVARIVNAEDVLLPVVGWPPIKEWKVFYSEFVDWPAAGLGSETDFEYILSLNPDAVQTNLEYSSYPSAKMREEKKLFKEKLPGIPLISLDFRTPNAISRSVRTYGYILDREKDAQEFIDWHEGYRDIIKSRVEDTAGDEKPRFYVAGRQFYSYIPTSKDRRAQTITIAGGRNIADELIDIDDPKSPTALTVDPEWVVEQNPEYIFRVVHPGTTELSGYMLDDTAAVSAARQAIMDRPELAKVDAVVNGNVYIVEGHLDDGGGNTIIGSAYAAKLFYPELFKDIYPQAIHQEYVDKFCHFDFNVREHGVFWYPSPEWLL